MQSLLVEGEQKQNLCDSPEGFAVVHSASVLGVESYPVQVEVQLGSGLPGFDIVGLPERAVRESRVRVKAALDAIGIKLPPRRLVVNLAPAGLRNSGAGFDLAIAIGILAACRLVSWKKTGHAAFFGELSITGELRPIPGIVALLRSTSLRGLAAAIIPLANAE